jgi:hypothetical protein
VLERGPRLEQLQQVGGKPRRVALPDLQPDGNAGGQIS